MDKKIKCQEQEDRLNSLEKIVLNTIRRDEFLYISHKYDYRFGSCLLQCFSCGFSDRLLSLHLFFFILSFAFTFALHMLAKWLVLMLVPSATSISLCVIAIRLIITIQVSPPH